MLLCMPCHKMQQHVSETFVLWQGPSVEFQCLNVHLTITKLQSFSIEISIKVKVYTSFYNMIIINNYSHAV